MDNIEDLELAQQNLELKELFALVDENSKKAFRNLSSFHDECRANLKALHSWENRKSYTYHNNVDVPLFYKVVESLVPYESSGTLEPGCTALRPEDVEAARSMNQQLKYFNNTREAKRARAEAVLWKIISGVGILKDGWNFKQDRHRRWVVDDEELMYLASESNDPILSALAKSIEQLGPDTPPDELEQRNAEIVQSVKKYLRQPGQDGGPICPSIIPSGDGFIIYDIDQYDAPALEAIPTYDIAWLGTGHDIQKYDAIYHRYYLTKTQIRNIQRDAQSNKSSGWVNLDYVCNFVDPQNSESEEVAQDYDRDIADPNSYEFIEETKRDETGEIVVTTICPKAECVVRFMKSPFFHNQFNFTPLVMNQGITDIRGTSIFRPIESLCMAIEKQLNSLLDNSDLVQNPAFRVSKGSQMTDRQISLYAGKQIPARPGDIEPIVIPDIRSTTVEIINYLISMIYSITGCPEVLDSVIPMMGNGNGKADLEELKFSTTARLRAALNADSIALSGLMERECSNIMQFCRYPRKIPFNHNGRTEYIDYQPNLTSGSFRFMTDASTMLAPDPSVLRAQLTSLINMAPGLTVAYLDEESGQLVQRNQLNIRNILRMWAEYSNVGDPEQFFVSPESIEAIPAQALPPVPQPPQEEQPPQGEGEGGTPPGGGMPPHGGTPPMGPSPQQPDPMQMLSQIPPDMFFHIASQPDMLQTIVQQGAMPPELAEVISQLLQAVMQDPNVLQQLVAQGVLTPESAQAIMAGLQQMMQAQQQVAPSSFGGVNPFNSSIAGSATPAPMLGSSLSSPQYAGSSMVPSIPAVPLGATPPPQLPLPSEQELVQMAQMVNSSPPQISLEALLKLPPEVLAILLPYLSPEFVQWFLTQIPPEPAQFLMNPSGQINMDGGLSISPSQAVSMAGGSVPPAGGAGGGFNTASGTNGMPPQLGGGQQAAAHPVVSPQQLSVKSRTSDVRQSANTIQQ